jgi:hypothetical protein
MQQAARPKHDACSIGPSNAGISGLNPGSRNSCPYFPVLFCVDGHMRSPAPTGKCLQIFVLSELILNWNRPQGQICEVKKYYKIRAHEKI